MQDHETDNEIQIKLSKIILFLQISMNVTMESMIAFLVWLPVWIHWVRLIAPVTMDT